MSRRDRRLWLGGHGLDGGVKMPKPYCAQVGILGAVTARCRSGQALREGSRRERTAVDRVDMMDTMDEAEEGGEGVVHPVHRVHSVHLGTLVAGSREGSSGDHLRRQGSACDGGDWMDGTCWCGCTYARRPNRQRHGFR